MGNERLVELGRILVSRREQMPEGSTTTRLYKEGPPRIIAKGTEELGEVFQALLEEDDKQVNLEISQATYYLLVWTVYRIGSLDGLIEELKRRELTKRELPETLGLAFRNCTECMGKAYQVLLSETSSNYEINSSVVSAILSFKDAMAVAGKGSMDGVWERI